MLCIISSLIFQTKCYVIVQLMQGMLLKGNILACTSTSNFRLKVDIQLGPNP